MVASFRLNLVFVSILDKLGCSCSFRNNKITLSMNSNVLVLVLLQTDNMITSFDTTNNLIHNFWCNTCSYLLHEVILFEQGTNWVLKLKLTKTKSQKLDFLWILFSLLLTQLKVEVHSGLIPPSLATPHKHPPHIFVRSYAFRPPHIFWPWITSKILRHCLCSRYKIIRNVNQMKSKWRSLIWFKVSPWFVLDK